MMCRTVLTRKEDGSVKVKTPKSRGKTITIVDIEDPLTRKKLEELTLIPGVNRKKALLLYQSGIHSIEEFLQKAYHGERFSENYSRTVANKLLVQSLKNKKKKADIPCPSCKAPNPPEADKCKVCNFEIKKEMESINMASLSGKLSESVTELLAKLDESDDFKALPDEMKAQLATIVESEDVEFDMEKPKVMDSMGIDLDKIEAEVPAKQVQEKETPDPEQKRDDMSEPEGDAAEPDGNESDKAEEPGKEVPATFKTKLEEAIAPKTEMASVANASAGKSPVQDKEPQKDPEPSPKPDAKKEKVRRILTEKLEKWRKAGYDTAGLEAYLEDVEGFKAKAKEVLAAGKVIRNKYRNQLDMWKEKGFDISELEPLLDTDLDAFAEKAKEILKKQKKK